MMIIAAVCWGVWCLRNKTTFDNYNARTPLEAVFTACSFMLYWAGLLKEDDKTRFQAGVKRLAQVAAALADRPYTHGRGSWETGMVFRLASLLSARCSLGPISTGV